MTDLFFSTSHSKKLICGEHDEFTKTCLNKKFSIKVVIGSLGQKIGNGQSKAS